MSKYIPKTIESISPYVEWTSVDDFLPKQNKLVLVSTKTGMFTDIAAYFDGTWIVPGNDNTGHVNIKYTHWLPLPVSPDEYWKSISEDYQEE